MNRQFISFPKSGRTWIRYILVQLGIEQDIFFHHDHFEFNDGDLPEHNFDLDMRLKKYRNVDKIVYLQRDPRDVMVSLFFQVTGRFKEFFLFDENVSAFIRHEYFGADVLHKFRLMWHEISNLPNVLVVNYEDCHEDMTSVIKKIVSFYEYDISDQKIAEAVHNSSIDKMRRVEKEGGFSKPWLLPKNGSFKVRKGKRGGYKEELKGEDVLYLNGVFCIKDASNTDKKKLLVAWFDYSLDGGLGRFIHCARVLRNQGHAVEFLSLNNSLETDWPDLKGRVRTMDDVVSEKWDAVMVPGAGMSDDKVPLFGLLNNPTFGVRVQHILNDSFRKDKFLKVNKVLNPDVVIFNNSHWESFVEFDADIFLIIPGAVDTKIHHPVAEKRLPSSGEKWKIAGYGRKNPEPLIKAVLALPKNCELHLYGIMQCEGRAARKLARQGRLKLWGTLFDKDLSDFYNGMDVVVTSELHAGWCNTTAQAMAHGLPVVCSKAGAVDFSENKKNSLLLDEVSAEAISKKILSLIGNPEFAYELSRNAAEDMKKFSWDNYCSHLLGAIEKPKWKHYYREPSLGLYGKRNFNDRLVGLDFLFDKVYGHTVLDVGAAEGLVSLYLAKNCGVKSIDGFEYDSSRVHCGRDLIKNSELDNVNLFNGDLSSWETFKRQNGHLLKDEYDTVLFLGLYHHLPVENRKTVLVELCSLAKTWFVIRVPDKNFKEENIDNSIRASGFHLISRVDQEIENESGTLCVYQVANT